MDPNGSGGNRGAYGYTSSSGYAMSGKIMLSAIVILFTVVIMFIGLHLYARWYLFRARRRSHARRIRRRTQIVFSFEPSGAASANTVFARGLDESVLKSLPTFVYSSATHGSDDGVRECAVCLSEFEEDEKGRLLPKCNHCFHIDCIDMWFQSHSTCPLCRAPVNSEFAVPARPIETPGEVAVRVDEQAEPESGPSSGLCPSCHFDRDEIGCSSSISPPSSSGTSSSSSSSSSSPYSSLETPRETVKAVSISIEVPRRNENLRVFAEEEEELRLGSPGGQGLKSPGGQQGLKSPGGRILSLKRILSREWKGCLSPPSGAGLSNSTAVDIDLESGEEQRVQAQPKL